MPNMSVGELTWVPEDPNFDKSQTPSNSLDGKIENEWLSHMRLCELNMFAKLLTSSYFLP